MNNLDFMNLFSGKQADLFRTTINQNQQKWVTVEVASMVMEEEAVMLAVLRGFDRGSPNPKPVEVGKEYDVDITEFSSKEMMLRESKDL